jgi:hypothetical protein
VCSGYAFSAGAAAATGCAPNYIQTSGNAVAGTCGLCQKSGTKTAADFADQFATTKTGWPFAGAAARCSFF